jgi:hypothetical protein
VLSVYYLHRLDNAKLVRYAGFARQSLRELPFVPPDLAASVRMLQVSLYNYSSKMACHVMTGPHKRQLWIKRLCTHASRKLHLRC